MFAGFISPVAIASTVCDQPSAQGPQKDEDGTIEGRIDALAVRRPHNRAIEDVLVLQRLASKPVVEHRRPCTLVEAAIGGENAPGIIWRKLGAGALPPTTASASSFSARSCTSGSRRTPIRRIVSAVIGFAATLASSSPGGSQEIRRRRDLDVRSREQFGEPPADISFPDDETA